ncbi:MAG: Na+/H+ antiporter NhaA [Gemmatimonadales bacterium]
MSPAAYFLLGVPLWVAVLKSGVHATLAGVVLAMFIPLRPARKEDADPDTGGSLLRRLEHTLHPWVAYGVLPLFAFANAGVPLLGLSLSDVGEPVPLGIVTGLFVGKQVGILALCWLAVRLRLATLPEGVSWRALHGTSLLCGIGFTMSLFIASLAFEQGAGSAGGLDRLGILLGSLLSGLGGYLLLRAALPGRIPGDQRAASA